MKSRPGLHCCNCCSFKLEVAGHVTGQNTVLHSMVATLARYLPYCVRASVHNSLSYYVKLFIQTIYKNRVKAATIQSRTTQNLQQCPATSCHSCNNIDRHEILFFLSVYNALEGV